MRAREAGEPVPLPTAAGLPIEITPENYKFLEELSKERWRGNNISIEECLNQLMKQEMKREMLKKVNPWYRQLMDKFDEEVREWEKKEKERGKKKNNIVDK
jgi:hypothetical protein